KSAKPKSNRLCDFSHSPYYPFVVIGILLPKLAGKVKPEAAPTIAPVNGNTGTATDEIEQLLASDPKKEFSYSDVLTKLPSVKKASVAALLFRLQRKNKVLKTGRGLWKTTKLI